jgi:cobyrinic acid a,c-diamide synthase
MSSQFLISAPSSNSGKTTLTLGLLRALKNKGMRIQPFKCGPDYIDTIHHTKAAGKQSVNLDTFMASEEHVKGIYSIYSCNADVSVTEGVMGLFDGSDKMQGSSAAIAELLNVPVILVINARSMAYSAAPLIYGFKNFKKEIRVVGVIFNFVNTASHYSFLKDACADAGVEALGYLPENKSVTIPSRHLGLHISSETDYENIIETLAAEIPKTIDLDRLLAITEQTSKPAIPDFDELESRSNYKIAVARDDAFSFVYHQNLEVLKGFGEITYFSPIGDQKLPEADLLYLPGGYPELFCSQLSSNKPMVEQIRQYCERGGLTYAECGGMMYLGSLITDNTGRKWEMTDVLNCGTTLENTKLTLGYRTVQWDNLYMKGHEFHYSKLAETAVPVFDVIVKNAKGIEVETQIFRSKNTFASYVHLYWGDKPEFISWLFENKI